MKRLVSLAALAAAVLLPATAALAAPGLGSKVYGTQVNKGEFELESRYGRLVNGPDDGEWGWVDEAAYGFTDRFYGAALVEVEREPGSDAEVEAVSLEGVYEVGRLPGAIGFAVYGEYEAALHGEPDAVELKVLFEKAVGRFDARVNLIAGRSLDDNGAWAFGYAASADWEVAEDVRLGVQAFGDAGDEDGFGGRREHFVGPAAEVEFDELPIDGELEISAGYLFALGAARDDADGQARLTLEYKRAF
jgi:hypothetical protein